MYRRHFEAFACGVEGCTGRARRLSPMAVLFRDRLAHVKAKLLEAPPHENIHLSSINTRSLLTMLRHFGPSLNMEDKM